MDADPTTRLLLDAIDALPDPAWCEGRCAVSGLALATPEGVRSLADADLDVWLREHTEPAPYGDATGTHYDTAIRDTRRLKARGATRIVGFDPSRVLREIERELATDCRIDAELLDVLVYAKGSRFVAHKDTPRYDDQLGTLIVELPHEHRGGAVELADGDRTATIDWSGPAASDGVRWVALFGDVEHEITPVTSGLRLTAVYTLRYRTDERVPTSDRGQMDTLIDAAIHVYAEELAGQILAIPCGRMIVAPSEATFPLTHASLRGADRLIAAALERAGIAVAVRACVAVAYNDAPPLAEAFDEARARRSMVFLRRTLPDGMVEGANAIAWAPDPSSDYGYVIADIGSYVDSEDVPSCTWLIRKRARILGQDMMFSHSGYFGNEYSPAHVYRFALMLADVPAGWDRESFPSPNS